MGKMKQMFSFGFTNEDMIPLIQMQQTALRDNALTTWLQQSILNENIMKKQHDMEYATVLAQALTETRSKETRSGGAKESGKEGEKETTSTYAITYFNPELQKTEVLEGKTAIKIKDYATKSIEESVAGQSAMPLYQFIAMPLIRKEVLPWKLEEILAEREYGTPPPPPTGASVTPVRVIVRKESEIAAEKKRDEEVKSALAETVLRKERSELKLDEEILLLEEVVSALRAGEDVDKVLERLPPLSRARFILAMRKKNLGRQALIALLIRDTAFLKSVKKKLELFTLDDLLGIYRALRGLQRR